ncbi:MAG: hypothetical protein AAB590_01660 [Patescibacteria group bacterium]
MSKRDDALYQSHLREAKKARKTGNLQEALNHYVSASLMRPTDMNVRREVAEAQLSLGYFHEAGVSYIAIIGYSWDEGFYLRATAACKRLLEIMENETRKPGLSSAILTQVFKKPLNAPIQP